LHLHTFIAIVKENGAYMFNFNNIFVVKIDRKTGKNVNNTAQN